MNDSKIITNLNNLKIIRESKGITQIKLSVDLGVSQELISRYELGYSFPQPSMLIRIAKYFNCSVDYLLGLTDFQTPVQYLADKNNSKNFEILDKYNSLSEIDKKHLYSYLNYLYQENTKK